MIGFENFKSQVVIRNLLPMQKLDPETHFLLYDIALEKIKNEELDIQNFIADFPHRLGVRSGEDIKNFRDFPRNLDMILRSWPEPMKRSHTLIVLGGGSLGDFGGFVASILKRGIGLVHIPSTWLAAMDSAHGGKTALNLTGVKNQLGTFYPAQKVYIVKALLEANPLELKEQSYGELIKMALIGESQFFKEITLEKRPPVDFLWRFLKFCIEDKYQIVLQDPYELGKIRQVLNFGHTFGHALESHFQWSHGDSVMQGLFFALEWSRYRGELSQPLFEEIMRIISEKFQRVPAYQLDWYRRPSSSSLAELVGKDKKLGPEGKISFVFLKSVGKPVVKPVAVRDLLSEAKRQSWVK